MRVMCDGVPLRHLWGMERQHVSHPVSIIALAVGALTVAAVGSGILGATAPGEADFVTQNAIGLVGALLLALGIVGFRPALAHVAGGRLLRWGLVLVWSGLGAMAAGHAVAIATAAIGTGPVQNDLTGAAAIVGIPLTIGAHLIYPGTSLVGLAMLRARRAPVALCVLLTASLPVLLIGVPAGLTLGKGALGEIVTWIATEGQIGAAWFAVAIAISVLAQGRYRRPASV